MNAYRVHVALYENGEATESVRVFLTIAKNLTAAAEHVEKAVTAEDEPEPGFKWEAVITEKLKEKLAIPALKEIKPKLDEGD